MENRHVFLQSAGDRSFWLHDGRKIDTIKELYEAIDDMDDMVFSHHVTSDRNDFSAWINEVFGAQNLAANIFNLSDRQEIKKVMQDWISYKILEKNRQEGNRLAALERVFNYRKQSPKHNKKEENEEKEKGLFVRGAGSAGGDMEPGSVSGNAGGANEDLLKDVDLLIRKDLEDLKRPKSFLTGIFDFVLGFIIGVLSMLLLVKMIP